jgi:hypothetical protein
MCEFIGHQGYEFILLMNEFISGSVMCEVPPHINAAYHYCPEQLGCIRLPWPARIS